MVNLHVVFLFRGKILIDYYVDSMSGGPIRKPRENNYY